MPSCREPVRAGCVWLRLPAARALSACLSRSLPPTLPLPLSRAFSDTPLGSHVAAAPPAPYSQRSTSAPRRQRARPTRSVPVQPRHLVLPPLPPPPLLALLPQQPQQRLPDLALRRPVLHPPQVSVLARRRRARQLPSGRRPPPSPLRLAPPRHLRPGGGSSEQQAPRLPRRPACLARHPRRRRRHPPLAGCLGLLLRGGCLAPPPHPRRPRRVGDLAPLPPPPPPPPVDCLVPPPPPRRLRRVGCLAPRPPPPRLLRPPPASLVPLLHPLRQSPPRQPLAVSLALVLRR